MPRKLQDISAQMLFVLTQTKLKSSEAEVIYYPTDKQCHKPENHLTDATILID